MENVTVTVLLEHGNAFGDDYTKTVGASYVCDLVHARSLRREKLVSFDDPADEKAAASVASAKATAPR